MKFQCRETLKVHDIVIIHKGHARAGRYSTPTAPVDPWMQRRREPWRKGRS